GFTSTVTTGTSLTVIVAVPCAAPLVAVMVAVPGAIAVTLPVALTVAAPVLLDAHVTVRPESGLPCASVTVAASCSVCVTNRVAEPGEMTTALAGTGETVTGTFMCAGPLVAVTVAGPAAMPVTRPVDDTVAVPGLSTDHVTAAPAITAPDASFTVAVSCDVCPTVMPTLVGAMVTVAGVCAPTDSAAVPGMPSLVAVIVVGPTLTPVTRPVLLTVAMVGSALDQVMMRPASGLPSASTGCAWNWNVCPTLITCCVGVTCTAATGLGSTVMLENPEMPFELAAICTLPVSTVVTAPLLDTVAMFALDVFQKTLAPLTVWPCAFTTRALSVTPVPTTSESVAGVTTILAPPPPDGPVELPPHETSARPASTAKAAAVIERCTARIESSEVARGPMLMSKAHHWEALKQETWKNKRTRAAKSCS